MSSANTATDADSDVMTVGGALSENATPGAQRTGRPIGFFITFGIVIFCAIGL